MPREPRRWQGSTRFGRRGSRRRRGRPRRHPGTGSSTGSERLLEPLVLLRDLATHLGAVRLDPVEEVLVGEGEDLDGQERGVGGARLADGDGGDGDARGHLDGRVERVGAAERGRGHRHADHRDRRQRRHHAREVRGPAGGRDEDLEPPEAGRRRVLVGALGRAMRGDDRHLVGHVELVEEVETALEDGQVAVAAHDDADDPPPDVGLAARLGGIGLGLDRGTLAAAGLHRGAVLALGARRAVGPRALGTGRTTTGTAGLGHPRESTSPGPRPALPRERRSGAAPVDGIGGVPASREGTVRVRIAIVAALVLLLCGLGWTVLRVARLDTAAVLGAPEGVVDSAPRTAEPVHASAPTPPPTLVAPSSLGSDASIAARLAAIEKRLDAMEKASEADRVLAAAAKAALDDILRERMLAGETAVIATARNAISAQAQFQMSARCDVDHDGTGEYGGFLEMSGAVAGRMASPLNPPVLSRAFRTLLANGEVSRGGYLFRIYLPNARGAGIGEGPSGFAPGDVDADLSETTWCMYAWPEEYGRTGLRTFFTNQGGDVLATEFSGYSGTGAGPSADAAFRVPGSITGAVAIGVTAADGHVWKQVN